MVALNTGTHRVPDELRRHQLADDDGNEYSTNLDRNRYGNDDQYLFTVIKFNLEALGLCPLIANVEIIDAKAQAEDCLVVKVPESFCACHGERPAGLPSGPDGGRIIVGGSSTHPHHTANAAHQAARAAAAAKAAAEGKAPKGAGRGRGGGGGAGGDGSRGSAASGDRRVVARRRAEGLDRAVARPDDADVAVEARELRGGRGRDGDAPRRARAGWRDAAAVAAAPPLAAARGQPEAAVVPLLGAPWPRRRPPCAPPPRPSPRCAPPRRPARIRAPTGRARRVRLGGARGGDERRRRARARTTAWRTRRGRRGRRRRRSRASRWSSSSRCCSSRRR